MKYFLFLFLFLNFIIQILSDEEEEDPYNYYTSPCENSGIPKRFEDCLGKSCEFIEEKCCYLESKNTTTNEIRKECVDLNFYDYMKDDLKQNAINAIKNGEYWEDFNETYDEIISLRCASQILFHQIFLYLLILFV